MITWICSWQPDPIERGDLKGYETFPTLGDSAFWKYNRLRHFAERTLKIAS